MQDFAYLFRDSVAAWLQGRGDSRFQRYERHYRSDRETASSPEVFDLERSNVRFAQRFGSGRRQFVAVSKSKAFGALATFLTGMSCALLLRRGVGRSATVRLFLLWMTYDGFFMSLPQVVVGAVNPLNDVGMAMDYLRLGTTAKLAAAFVALAAMPLVALSLRHAVLGLAEEPGSIANMSARTRFVFRVATLPALLAILLIIPFRVPRGLIEVVVVPVVVTVIGIAWLQAGAWRVGDIRTGGSAGPDSIVFPAVGLLALLIVFQALLRPGIRFY